MSKRIIAFVILLFAIVIAFISVGIPSELRAPTNQQTTSVEPATRPDLVVVNSPLPGTTVRSPLVISGKARGPWYFEGSAPIFLLDASGTVVASGHITAQGEWTTTDFVPFTVTLTFTTPTTTTGTLILKNDNPSGDPTKDKRIEIPVRF